MAFFKDIRNSAASNRFMVDGLNPFYMHTHGDAPWITVTEKWTFPDGSFVSHTHEFRMRLHFQLDSMEAAGDFVRNSITGDRSVYASDGSPTKIFTSLRAADEYLRWIAQEYTPAHIEIRQWLDIESVNLFLKSIRDPQHQGHLGPTDEEKRQYRIQLGLPPVDKV